MSRHLALAIGLLVTPVLAAAPVTGRPSNLLQATVVSGECQSGVEGVLVSVSYRGKLRTNVTRSDHHGNFEVDMTRLYPDWVPGSSVVVGLGKHGYVEKHRNLELTAAAAAEIPLERDGKSDAAAARYANLTSYRKEDCSSWTVFAVPHKSDADVVFPDYDHAQEMHLRLSTYFQELDLPIEKLPSIGVEWLENARDLNLTGSEPASLGAYLNAIAVLYGNVEAKREAVPKVSSYLQIVADADSRIGVTKVAQRTPFADVDEDIYKDDSDYIKTLTRTTLFAAVYREIERSKALPNSPNHDQRLEKIRDFITAERKTFPKTAAQNSVEKSNLRTLDQLQAAVNTSLSGNPAAMAAAQ
jgi:hypothetical protein